MSPVPRHRRFLLFLIHVVPADCLRSGVARRGVHEPGWITARREAPSLAGCAIRKCEPRGPLISAVEPPCLLSSRVACGAELDAHSTLPHPGKRETLEGVGRWPAFALLHITRQKRCSIANCESSDPAIQDETQHPTLCLPSERIMRKRGCWVPGLSAGRALLMLRTHLKCPPGRYASVISRKEMAQMGRIPFCSRG